MTQVISTILKDVDRTIFKALDAVSTIQGYSVDRTVAGIRDDKVAWKAAEDVIIAAKGFVIGIRSSINAHDAGNKKVPRMVYRGQRTIPGNIGNTYGWVYEISGGAYNKQKEANVTSDYYFQIGIHAQKPEEYRVLQSIVAMAIEHHAHLIVHNVSTEKFLIIKLTAIDNWDEQKGTYDTIYQYKVCDLFETMPNIDTQTIAKINEITIEPGIGSPIEEIIVT